MVNGTRVEGEPAAGGDARTRRSRSDLEIASPSVFFVHRSFSGRTHPDGQKRLAPRRELLMSSGDAFGSRERQPVRRGPDPDDPVAENRAAPRRGAPPGRPQTGWPVTRRWLFTTAVVLVVATCVLVAAVVRA